MILGHRSEVVGRPLAALLSNDGARVFSVDIDSIQVPVAFVMKSTAMLTTTAQEYTKRPSDLDSSRKYHPRHIVRPPPEAYNTLQACLAVADVVVAAVPNATYKIPTAWLKDGCVCVNVAAEKNFEKDVREKVGSFEIRIDPIMEYGLLIPPTGIVVHPSSGESYHTHAASKFVRITA